MDRSTRSDGRGDRPGDGAGARASAAGSEDVRQARTAPRAEDLQRGAGSEPGAVGLAALDTWARNALGEAWRC
jgi:hypothetical protein